MSIKREIRRAFSTKEVKIAFLIYLIFYLFVSYSKKTSYVEDFPVLFTNLFFIDIKNNVNMQTFYFVLPLFCGIVGSDVFAKDVRSGMIKNISSREPIRNIILKKAIVSFLSAGFFVISVFVIDILLKMAIYPAVKPSFLGSYMTLNKTQYGYIFFYHPWLYVLIVLLINFCYSGLCGLLGFTVSLFTSKGLINKTFSFVLEFIKGNISGIISVFIFNFSYIMSFVGNFNNSSIAMTIGMFSVTFIILNCIILLRSRAYELK